MDYKKYLKINEAPLPADQMPTSNYLTNVVKSNITANKNNAAKNLVKPYIDEILKDIKDIKYSDISFSNSGSKYTILLPAPIVAKMKKLYDGTSPVYSNTVDGITSTRLKQSILDIVKNTFSTGSYTFKGTDPNSSSYIYMKIDSANRTHFPNSGINSDGLRGLGLGKKLYRALIGQVPYACSNSGAATGAQKAWAALTKPQFKADGSRDIDAEVYTFMLPTDYPLYAIATTRPKQEIFRSAYKILNKISDKTKLQTLEIRKANGIAVDPDFIQLCKDNMDNNDAKIVLNWVEPSPETRAAAEAAEQQRRAAEQERERLANAEADRRIKDKLLAYAGVESRADLSSDWQIGDYIVVKEYLFQEQNYPVRVVTKKEGNTYYAYEANNVDRNLVGTGQSRNTTNKNNWVKVLPPAVGSSYPPGINGNAKRTPRQPLRNTTTSASTTSTNTDTTNSNNIQNSLNFTADTDKEVTYRFNPRQKRTINNVSNLNNNLIYIPNREVIDFNSLNNGTPIFAYVSDAQNQVAINTKTGERKELTEGQRVIFNTLTTKYKRQALQSKTELSPGDLVYIRNHSKFFGYIAKVLRTNLTARGDNYVYLSVPGATGNRLTLTPVSLDRLIPVTNESFTYTTIFESYLNKVRNKK